MDGSLRIAPRFAERERLGWFPVPHPRPHPSMIDARLCRVRRKRPNCPTRVKCWWRSTIGWWCSVWAASIRCFVPHLHPRRRPAERRMLDAQGGTIACPRHGAKFDIQNRAAKTMPATQPTVAHEVKEEGDDFPQSYPIEMLRNDTCRFPKTPFANPSRASDRSRVVHQHYRTGIGLHRRHRPAGEKENVKIEMTITRPPAPPGRS